jgi:hypothetical protein
VYRLAGSPQAAVAPASDAVAPASDSAAGSDPGAGSDPAAGSDPGAAAAPGQLMADHCRAFAARHTWPRRADAMATLIGLPAAARECGSQAPSGP